MTGTVQLAITNLAPSSPGQAGGHSVQVPGLPGAPTWWRSARGRTVTIALLAGILVGLVGAFGPGQNDVRPQPPAYLAAMSATPATANDPADATTVVEQIGFGGVDFLPPAATSVEFRRIEVAPGASLSVLADAEGHSLYVIESGTLEASFESDVQMTEDGELHGVLIPGEVRPMVAGEGFVMESNFAGELHNTGTEPLELAVVMIVHAPVSQVTGSETIPLPKELLAAGQDNARSGSTSTPRALRSDG